MTERVDPGTPSGLDALLSRHGLAALKRLGQNFLVDPNVLAKIVAAAELKADESVLEIGPGAGALTVRLSAGAGRVVAVEIDRGLCRLLRELLVDHPNVELVEGDALDLDWAPILAGSPRPPKAVCNLPYYITTPLLFRLLESTPRFCRIVALMQREVAERLTARPGSKAYGTLSVMLAFHATNLETVATVSPNVFVPRPDVASAVVRIDLRPEIDLAQAAELSEVVRAAFGHRRKTLRRALAESGRWPAEQIDAALAVSRIDPARRGESLDLDAFWALTEAFRRAKA